MALNIDASRRAVTLISLSNQSKRSYAVCRLGEPSHSAAVTDNRTDFNRAAEIGMGVALSPCGNCRRGGAVLATASRTADGFHTRDRRGRGWWLASGKSGSEEGLP